MAQWFVIYAFVIPKPMEGSKVGGNVMITSGADQPSKAVLYH